MAATHDVSESPLLTDEARSLADSFPTEFGDLNELAEGLLSLEDKTFSGQDAELALHAVARQVNFMVGQAGSNVETWLKREKKGTQEREYAQAAAASGAPDALAGVVDVTARIMAMKLAMRYGWGALQSARAVL